MKFQNIDKLLLGWIALVTAQILAALVVPLKAPISAHAFEWLLVADFLIAAVLGLVALRSDWSGWRLAAVMAGIPFAISMANMLAGAAFLKPSENRWRMLSLYTCVTYAVAFLLWRYIFGRAKPTATRDWALHQNTTVIAWKFVTCDVTYVMLYITAGLLIVPYVRTFYATQALPSPGTIVGVQLFLRGPLFIGLCLLLARMIALPRWLSALAVGSAFTILSGVAPFLMPDTHFPDAVRWANLGEVTSANFLLGAIVSLFWGKSKPARLRLQPKRLQTKRLPHEKLAA